MKILKNYFLLAGLGLVLLGCYPQDIDSVRELTSVVTSYDVDYDFSSKSTYFLVDSIPLSTNIKDPDFDEDALRAYQEVILDEIAAQLDDLGYARMTGAEAIATPPDLVVTASAMGNKQDGTAWIPGGGWWWWGYPWDYWGGWGWYYPPGWGGYPVYYSYTTGTLMMFIADYEDAGVIGDDLIPLEWNSAINGLLENSPTNERVRELIDQAFAQSPYLGTN